MASTIDMTGLTFGKLIVLKQVESSNRQARWLCKCDCGNEVVVAGGHLRNRNTQSCGCLRKEKFSEINPRIYKPEYHTKICINCNKEYQISKSKFKTSKYCSQKCRHDHGETYLKKGIYKSCELCQKEFYVMPSSINLRKYCCKKCADKAAIGEKLNIRKGIYKQCKHCQKEYYVPQYLIEISKFCSKECQNHGQYDKNKDIKICPVCNKSFQTTYRTRRKKYCSYECRLAEMKTLTEQRNKIKLLQRISRGKMRSQELRKYVFESKPKTCEICGYNEYDFCLDVHHIDQNPQNNELNNLKVICVICHRKYHKKIIDINGNII